MAMDINSFLNISNNLYSFAVDNFSQEIPASTAQVDKNTSLLRQQLQSPYPSSKSGNKNKSKPTHQKAATMDDHFFSMDLSPTNLKDSFDFTQDDEENGRVEMKNHEDGDDRSENRSPKAEGNLTSTLEGTNNKTPSKSSTSTPSRSIFSGLSFFKSLVSSSKTSKGEGGASRKSHSRHQSLDAEHDLEANIMGSSTNTAKFATPSLAVNTSNSNSNSNSNSSTIPKTKSIRHSRSHSYFLNDIYGRNRSSQKNSSSGSGSGSGVIEYQESPLKSKDDNLTSFSCSIENICFDFIRLSY